MSWAEQIRLNWPIFNPAISSNMPILSAVSHILAGDDFAMIAKVQETTTQWFWTYNNEL
ncbi:hypothetical protein [Iodobacter fluviatilis]|uniref:hypothetical protein n=1 Tax=Iodobacter fluviatilis TaxID=537 RepID=UPI00165E912A|nr:hypothetical protein [Iodobacter fluviatilis]